MRQNGTLLTFFLAQYACFSHNYKILLYIEKNTIEPGNSKFDNCLLNIDLLNSIFIKP